MQSSIVETIIGAVVLVVAGLFVAFVYASTGSAGGDGYQVLARFNRVDGVNVGTEVRMSGIRIGTVSELKLDPKNFLAVAYLSISNDVKLPADSSVRITSEGILSGQYLSIEPGSDTAVIPQGGEIEHTQGSIDLIGLLSKMAMGGGTGP